jgi:hypothetical protein
MRIYHYDASSGHLLYEGLADPNPKVPDDWIVPAHATTKKPPRAGEGKVARFDPAAGEWSVVDHEPPEPPAAAVRTLDEVKLQALARVERAVTMRYQAEVPAPAIAAEYLAGYMAAKEWLLYPDRTPPRRVVALAEVRGTTNEDAAKYVVARWDNEARRLDEVGAERIRMNAAIRAAEDEAAVVAVLNGG